MNAIKTSARAAVSSEGSTGAEGFTSKVTDPHAWPVSPGCWGEASGPLHIHNPRRLCEHPDNLAAGSSLVREPRESRRKLPCLS